MLWTSASKSRSRENKRQRWQRALTRGKRSMHPTILNMYHSNRNRTLLRQRPNQRAPLRVRPFHRNLCMEPLDGQQSKSRGDEKGICARSTFTSTGKESCIQAVSWNTEALLKSPKGVAEGMARKPSLSAQKSGSRVLIYTGGCWHERRKSKNLSLAESPQTAFKPFSRPYSGARRSVSRGLYLCTTHDSQVHEPFSIVRGLLWWQNLSASQPRPRFQELEDSLCILTSLQQQKRARPAINPSIMMSSSD